MAMQEAETHFETVPEYEQFEHVSQCWERQWEMGSQETKEVELIDYANRDLLKELSLFDRLLYGL